LLLDAAVKTKENTDIQEGFSRQS